MRVLMREVTPVRRRETHWRGSTCFRGYSWEEGAGVGAVGAGVVGAGATGAGAAGAGAAGAGVGAGLGPQGGGEGGWVVAEEEG